MHKRKDQFHTAACFKYHRPTYFSQMLNRGIQKSPSNNEKHFTIFWKRFRKMGQPAEKKINKKNNRTRQKNRRGDSNVESNDSPEIPDEGRHQTSPAFLRGLEREGSHLRLVYAYRLITASWPSSPSIGPCRRSINDSDLNDKTRNTTHWLCNLGQKEENRQYGE